MILKCCDERRWKCLVMKKILSFTDFFFLSIVFVINLYWSWRISYTSHRHLKLNVTKMNALSFPSNWLLLYTTHPAYWYCHSSSHSSWKPEVNLVFSLISLLNWSFNLANSSSFIFLYRNNTSGRCSAVK